MKLKCLLAAILSLMLVLPSIALAYSSQDVAKILEAVKNDYGKLLSYQECSDGTFYSFRVVNGKRHKVLEVTIYQGKPLKCSDNAFQSVYVINGKRYTVYYPGGEHPFLSFWVRPNSTSEWNVIKTFSDHGLDGKVEFGIQTPPDRYTFNIDDKNIGLEHQEYWQKIYNEAIADAIQHFGIK